LVPEAHFGLSFNVRQFKSRILTEPRRFIKCTALFSQKAGETSQFQSTPLLFES
jgi:hypothetical protein